MGRGRLDQVCVGTITTVPWAGRLGRTAIDKRAVTEPVAVGPLGLAGDEQADHAHHGGPDQALYAYSVEDADHWVADIGRDLPAGMFGENLRVSGLAVSDAPIGTRWRIGAEVVVEVTAPRIPCRVFAGFWNEPDLIRRFIAAGRPGAYLRVVTTGTISAGDAVSVVAAPDHDVTPAQVMRVMTSDASQAQLLVPARGELSATARTWLDERIGPA